MQFITQNQTDEPIVFLMLDSADSKTGKTGLSPTVTISKNGGSPASPSGAVSEVGNGLYKIAGNATDADTLGPLVVHATATGADPSDTLVQVVAFSLRDAVRLGLTAMPNAAAGASGGLPTGDASGRVAVQVGTSAGQINSSGGKVPATIAAGDLAADSVTASALATDAVTEIQNGLATAAGVSAVETKVDAVDDYLDTEIAAIKAKTDNLPASPAAVGSEMTLADSEDVYPADVQLTIDDTNTRDEYTVAWFRNGSLQTSGITTPLIQVIKRADGTDLVASTAMTQIGSTGSYKYDESTNRITPGESVLVRVTATINGSARTWQKVVTRDIND